MAAADHPEFDFSSAPASGAGTKRAAPVDHADRPAPAYDPGRPRKSPDFLGALNDMQREAVLTTEGPLIVLAGAGSGKTKMLTSRIAYLVEGCGVAPYHILAVTFTNKAAAEMKERVEKHLASTNALGHPEIGTFHSVCVRLLRRELAATPFTQAFTIYDDSDQLSLIKGVCAKLNIDEKVVSPKSLQSRINAAKCDATEPADVEPAPHNIFDRHFKRVYEQYQQDLVVNNALDFGEILTMTYRLLRDHPAIRAKYQHRWRYIHVDEYQDTNRAQYLLLNMLAAKQFGGHQNICVVGDEDQSIYKWRGADIRNILDFEQDYPGAHIVKLEQNYRSTQNIIKAAGHVIRNNTSRKDKTLWTDNDEGLKVGRVQLPDERAEAEMVVSEIKRLAENEDRTFRDFAILYRTHAQSRPFEDAFRREKVPYQIIGGLRFYDRKEIKDILSYFKVVLNTADSIALKRVINVPARAIGKTTIEKIDALQVEWEKEARESAASRDPDQPKPDTSYWGALCRAAGAGEGVTNAVARKLAGFVSLVSRLRAEQPKLLVSELYHLILDETGYVRELRQEATEEALARIENLEEFDNLLQEFEQDFFDRVPETERESQKPELLSNFLEQSSLASNADTADATGPTISMMTLHSSKGLEFPVVFLPGMEEGLFPSIRPWEEEAEEDVEEERRLCYVGMTRAREQLVMSNALVRRLWGDIKYQEPARFFKEIPAEFIDFKDLTRGSGAGQYRTGSSRQFGDFGGVGGGGAASRTPGRIVEDDFSQIGYDDDELIGQKLQHPEYGLGTIVASEGAGADQKVTIEFKGRDRRKFVFRYIKAFMGDCDI